jgi:hypothetical protein
MTTVLMGISSLGCGARDDPLGPEDLEPFEPAPPASGTPTATSGTATAGCVACEGQVECGHCLVQGDDNTIRCSLGIPVPLSGCLHLDEWHRDPSGALYTCYYCP